MPISSTPTSARSNIVWLDKHFAQPKTNIAVRLPHDPPRRSTTIDLRSMPRMSSGELPAELIDKARRGAGTLRRGRKLTNLASISDQQALDHLQASRKRKLLRHEKALSNSLRVQLDWPKLNAVEIDTRRSFPPSKKNEPPIYASTPRQLGGITMSGASRSSSDINEATSITSIRLTSSATTPTTPRPYVSATLATIGFFKHELSITQPLRKTAAPMVIAFTKRVSLPLQVINTTSGSKKNTDAQVNDSPPTRKTDSHVSTTSA
ncbi:hypothetical protein JCM8097_009368 [Rhodosporidiobolus ruineniae]